MLARTLFMARPDGLTTRLATRRVRRQGRDPAKHTALTILARPTMPGLRGPTATCEARRGPKGRAGRVRMTEGAPARARQRGAVNSLEQGLHPAHRLRGPRRLCDFRMARSGWHLHPSQVAPAVHGPGMRRGLVVGSPRSTCPYPGKPQGKHREVFRLGARRAPQQRIAERYFEGRGHAVR